MDATSEQESQWESVQWSITTLISKKKIPRELSFFPLGGDAINFVWSINLEFTFLGKGLEDMFLSRTKAGKGEMPGKRVVLYALFHSSNIVYSRARYEKGRPATFAIFCCSNFVSAVIEVKMTNTYINVLRTLWNARSNENTNSPSAQLPSKIDKCTNKSSKWGCEGGFSDLWIKQIGKLMQVLVDHTMLFFRTILQ